MNKTIVSILKNFDSAFLSDLPKSLGYLELTQLHGISIRFSDDKSWAFLHELEYVAALVINIE